MSHILRASVSAARSVLERLGKVDSRSQAARAFAHAIIDPMRREPDVLQVDGVAWLSDQLLSIDWIASSGRRNQQNYESLCGYGTDSK
jgi:hypothetical protein